jgi:transposase
MAWMLSSSVVLLYDNVHSHRAAHVWPLLENFTWELFDHPPYSPDLAPSDYHLRNWLESQGFSTNELMKSVKTWLSKHAAQIFVTGIQKLIPWYDKYLNYSNDYIEK